MFDAACVPQVTTHNWPTLDWNFCVPGTWVATTEGGYSGQTFDMKCNDNERGKSIKKKTSYNNWVMR